LRWALLGAGAGFMLSILPVPAHAGMFKKSSAPAVDTLRHVHVTGADLAYVSHGTGEPVILLHPSGLDLRVWAGEIEALSRSYHVIAYSRRHSFHGPPAPTRGPAETMDVHVRDLAGLIKELDLGPVHLVGHGDGGTIAAVFASEHPELVRSVILADPDLATLLMGTQREKGWVAQRNDSSFAARRQMGLALARMALRDGFDQLGVERWVEWEYGDEAAPALPKVIRAEMMENVGSLRSDVISGLADPKLGCDQLQNIEAPMLVIEGQNSPDYMHAMVDALVSCRPKTQRMTLKGATHAMLWTKANDVSRTTLEFLARGTPAPVAGE